MQHPHQDPNGVAFSMRGAALLQINRDHAPHYDHLIESGLYRELAASNLIVRYKESGLKYARNDDAYRVLKRQPLPGLRTYPHEWPFSAWKAAAMGLLAIAETALAHDMTLKRVSPWAVTLTPDGPLFTDLLAFELSDEGRRWGAYRQFVDVWLSPLALMATVDPHAGGLLRAYPNGLPRAMVSAMLPVRTRMGLGGLNTHIHASGRDITAARGKDALRETLLGLRETVEGLRWSPPDDASRNYDPTDYDTATEDYRRELVRRALSDTMSETVWDIHAGDGAFTHVARTLAGHTVAFAPSPVAAERLYQQFTGEAPNVQVAVIDWANPSPGLGWGYRDARGLLGRGSPDMLIALGWLQRVVLADGVPLPEVAALLAKLAPRLVIEFVPITDPHAIAQMRDEPPPPEHYSQDAFEAAFGAHYNILAADDVVHTERVIYHLERHTD